MTPLALINDLARDLNRLSLTLIAIVEQTKDSPAMEALEREPQKVVKAQAKETSRSGEETSQQKDDKPVANLEDVRAVLAEKSRKGHTAAVKELLIKHGADKLSEIDPKNYEALLADAEVL